jgi:glycosyltransferase involved in cell wall biosynthesis
MRIAYLLADAGIPMLGTKGASIHVREMLRALRETQTVDVFCAKLEPPSASGGKGIKRSCLEASLRLEGGEEAGGTVTLIPPPPISGDTPPDLARDQRRLATVRLMRDAVDLAFRARTYELIYERYSLYSDVGAAISRAWSVPFLLEVNAPLIVERGKVETLPLVDQARRIEGEVFRQADALLAVSAAMAEYAIGVGAARERVHVVPNGVDTERFRPDVSGDGTRQKLGIGPGPVIGFVGSLKPWHGVDLLLSAFARVARKDWTLLVVGEGPERASLERQASSPGSHGRVLFTGAVDHEDMPAHLAVVDVAVAPYRAVENFYFSPLKLYEYLAAGRAVVASDIGQIAEVIHHGENGYLVPAEDEGALARALLRLVDDGVLRAGLTRRSTQGLMSWRDTARRVIAIAQAVRA